MTRSLEEADELSALDAKVLREIHTDGWQITGVLAREQGNGPDFAYTIGLFHTLGHPEIILFGLPIDVCMRAVNLIALDIRNGLRFQPLAVYHRILTPPHTCCFREVDRKHYRGHVGYALWFYETDPFPLLQCFWSDEHGHFPWETVCRPWARDGQPLLFQ
ncbi:MAG TPA: DUF4262 domain-containing protein [Terracidiphilus sp.]|nr:DUF4262 domain-containing protein [Terracidiphilus sp.]